VIGIKGRGWRGGQVKLTPSGEGLRIRVDDDWDPELWFEVIMPAGTMVNLANAISVMRDMGADASYPITVDWGNRQPAGDVLGSGGSYVLSSPRCPKCGSSMTGGAPHGPSSVQYECTRCGEIVVPSGG
jgi:hypothetical protein